MQQLNLVHLEDSDIKYSISRFPDGEVQISLGDFSHKEQIQVKCRITNAEDLFILMQVLDILDRHEVSYVLSIYYLMGMRMDRVMNFNRPFTLKIVLNSLKNCNADNIEILEPHSDVYYDYRFGGKFTELYIEGSPSNTVWHGYQMVLPDAGAKERYDYQYVGTALTCSKVRDLTTGKILEIKIDNSEAISDKPLLILDDLCDGGGTFCGIAKAFNSLGIPKERLNIAVTHMVNPKGIKNLSENFNHVWFTNSYEDWENLPENVTMLKVI
jgi:ribose-phosphate pyrophosphokinase